VPCRPLEGTLKTKKHREGRKKKELNGKERKKKNPDVKKKKKLSKEFNFGSEEPDLGQPGGAA